MERISFIGAGNVATHLAKAFADVGYDVGQVYAPHIETATLLASQVDAEPIASLELLDSNSDMYVVSIKDNAVSSVLDTIAAFETSITAKLWVHTAGSVSIDVFPAAFAHCGVLYPLQTFSKAVSVDMSKVPFFIEGRNADEQIRKIALAISSKVYHADSNGRRQLHIAGVLGCNMPMYLWALAADVLDHAGYGFDVLHPLLQATLDKAYVTPPIEGMTGPARRGDTSVLENHLAELPDDIAPIYRFINNEILHRFGHETIK